MHRIGNLCVYYGISESLNWCTLNNILRTNDWCHPRRCEWWKGNSDIPKTEEKTEPGKKFIHTQNSQTQPTHNENIILYFIILYKNWLWTECWIHGIWTLWTHHQHHARLVTGPTKLMNKRRKSIKNKSEIINIKKESANSFE